MGRLEDHIVVPVAGIDLNGMEEVETFCELFFGKTKTVIIKKSGKITLLSAGLAYIMTSSTLRVPRRWRSRWRRVEHYYERPDYAPRFRFSPS